VWLSVWGCVMVNSRAFALVELCIHLWSVLLLLTRNFMFPKSWFRRGVTTMGQNKRWPCVNWPKLFCHIWGHFTFKSQFVADT